MILSLVTMLVVLGLITVYSATFALGNLEYGSVYYFVIRQTILAVIGVGLLLVLMRMDYHWLRAVSPLLMLAALAGLAAVLVPGIGVDRNGASRWIAFGPLPPLQPSEFAKLALIIYVSAWLTSTRRNVRSFAAGFAPFVLMVGLVAGLVMLEPDMGTTIIIVLTTVTLFFVAGGALSHLVAFMSIGGVTASFLVLTGGYRMGPYHRLHFRLRRIPPARASTSCNCSSLSAAAALPGSASAPAARSSSTSPAPTRTASSRLSARRWGSSARWRSSCCSPSSSIGGSASCSTRRTTSAPCSRWE